MFSAEQLGHLPSRDQPRGGPDADKARADDETDTIHTTAGQRGDHRSRDGGGAICGSVAMFDVERIATEPHILIERRLKDNPMTLEDLSQQYNISRERVRQIEVRGFEKLQKSMKAQVAEQRHAL